MTKRNHGRAHPLSAVPSVEAAPKAPSSPVPEGFDYYEGATEVARVLEDTGLTPSRAERKGLFRGGFCAVEATHPETWPAGVELCVEVTYYPLPSSAGRRGVNRTLPVPRNIVGNG